MTTIRRQPPPSAARANVSRAPKRLGRRQSDQSDRFKRHVLGLLVALTAAGCAGAQMKSDMRQVRTIAKEARDNGAYKCAPRELALADTNVEFVERELNQGDYFRARDHLRVADQNAREAYRLSPRDRCIPPPAPTKPGDADGDGIPDNVDKCPNEPEDKDGFQDEDGCPDPGQRQRRHPRQDGQVPERAGGQGRLPGRGRLPRSRQRRRRHPRQGRQVPERARRQGRLRGRGRLPGSGQRQGRRARRRRQVPERSGPAGQRRLPEEVRAHRRHAGEDRAQAEDLLRHEQGHDSAAQLLAARRDRAGHAVAADA